MESGRDLVSTRQMAEADLDLVVRMHVEGFPDSRSTRLGEPFLKRMYRWYLEYQSGLSLVAEAEGHLVGFVTGAIGGSSRRIFRYALPQVGCGFIRRPRLFFCGEMYEMWHSYVRGLLPSRRQQKPTTVYGDPHGVKATLDSITVSPLARGKGVGQHLVRAFEAAGWRAGATVLALGVERDNAAARHLYEKCGWALAKESVEMNSANYVKRFAGA